MTKESRTHKSLLNAKVNLTFYLLSLLLSFFPARCFSTIWGQTSSD